MASEYTPYYNLDLYTDADKPNLRDQYNSSMSKIDAQLHTSADSMAIATEAANQAKTVADAAKEAAESAATATAAEATARESADTELGKRIDTETSAREAADTALSAQIGAVKNTSLINGRVLAFGDSLTNGSSTSKFWPAYLADYTGANVTNYAVAGQGFVNNAGGTFLTQLNSAISAETSPSEVTHVIVAGGYNDYANSESTVKSAVATFVQTAKTAFPKACVVVVPMLCGIKPLDNAIGGASNDTFRSRLIEPIVYSATANGAVVAPAPWTWLKGYSEFDVDGIHVNNSGQAFIAGKIYGFMMGGSVLPFRTQKLTTSNSNISEFDVICAASGGMVSVRGHLKTTAELAAGTVLFNLPEWAYGSNYGVTVFSAGASYHDWAPSDDNGSRITVEAGTKVSAQYMGTGNTWFEMSWPMGI